MSKTSIQVTVFHGFMIGGESYESDDGLYIQRVGKYYTHIKGTYPTVFEIEEVEDEISKYNQLAE